MTGKARDRQVVTAIRLRPEWVTYWKPRAEGTALLGIVIKINAIPVCVE